MKTIEKQKTAEALLRDLFNAEMAVNEYQHRLSAGEDFQIKEYLQAIRERNNAKKAIQHFLRGY